LTDYGALWRRDLSNLYIYVISGNDAQDSTLMIFLTQRVLRSYGIFTYTIVRLDSHVILQGWLKYIFMNPSGVYTSRSWYVKLCGMFFDNLFYSHVRQILKYLFFFVLTTANIYILLTFDNYNNIPLRRVRIFLEES